MPRWTQIQTLHYQGKHSLRAISRQVGLSLSQVHRVVAGRLWRRDGERKRSPSRVVVNSVRGTPRVWARVLALNEVYRSRCRGENGLYKRMTARQGAYLKGIIKNRGLDHAVAAVAATESYVLSLASPGYSTVRDLAESGNSIPTTDALISLATRPSKPCISFAIASRTFWTTCGTL